MMVKAISERGTMYIIPGSQGCKLSAAATLRPVVAESILGGYPTTA
jgi:hypothetical protein